jgi:hypothetical protein
MNLDPLLRLWLKLQVIGMIFSAVVVVLWLAAAVILHWPRKGKP